MTINLALPCKDGILIATDRREELEGNHYDNVQKLRQVGSHAVAAFSGTTRFTEDGKPQSCRFSVYDYVTEYFKAGFSRAALVSDQFEQPLLERYRQELANESGEVKPSEKLWFAVLFFYSHEGKLAFSGVAVRHEDTTATEEGFRYAIDYELWTGDELHLPYVTGKSQQWVRNFLSRKGPEYQKHKNRPSVKAIGTKEFRAFTAEQLLPYVKDLMEIVHCYDRTVSKEFDIGLISATKKFRYLIGRPS